MNAGRELDALIAEKVMGLRGIGFWPEGGGHYYHTLPCEGIFDDVIQKVGIPHYSTQIADAWLVVEKFAEYSISRKRNETALCWLMNDNKLWRAEIAATAPLAICLAALKAVSEGI